MKAVTWFALALVLFGTAVECYGMEAKPTRVVLWRKGESIGGEEFLTHSEAIVDYLATLPRPTQGLKGFKYNCMAKTRTIRPAVNKTGINGETLWVYVTMVYELRDCVETH